MIRIFLYLTQENGQVRGGSTTLATSAGSISKVSISAMSSANLHLPRGERSSKILHRWHSPAPMRHGRVSRLRLSKSFRRSNGPDVDLQARKRSHCRLRADI